jgi:diguanylate cyclase (GGDEF)-like protein
MTRDVDPQALQAAAAASATRYASFAEATGAVLDLLERSLPSAAVFLAHLDRAQDLHRIVDSRRGAPFGLRSNLAVPLDRSFCVHMADGHAPRFCNDVDGHPLYGRVEAVARAGVGAYLGVPVELPDGLRVGSLAAYCRGTGSFTDEDQRLFEMLARLLATELERETSKRDRGRLDDSLRGQARGLGALNRLARALADGGDARPAVCEAASIAAGAPVTFLLEPAGRNFASTAVWGVDIAPITVQARATSSASPGGLMGREPYFVADARAHPALAAPLVEATGARSALFEPVVRDGSVVGVLILIWQTPVDRVDEPTGDVLELVAAQAAVAIEQAGLRSRVASLALRDELTGLASRRTFEEELPRELARGRRAEHGVCVAAIGLDHTSAFNMLRGERERDRLVKEAAAVWSAAVREVDLVARLEGDRFAILLPGYELGEAIEVVDRLRGLTPRGQTASAGVARWDGAEPGELLMLRCADALAAAKSAGRDLTVPAE